MSRHWHRVSQPIQKLAASMYPIMSEGMSPYEMYYVLATDEEIHRLNEAYLTKSITRCRTCFSTRIRARASRSLVGVPSIITGIV